MSDLAAVPLTITASQKYDFRADMSIARDAIRPPRKPSSITGGYWIVVVDRRSLKAVYNEVVETYDQAPDIGPYDTDEHMLFVTTMWLGTGHVPQGAFYDFLFDNGAGRALRRVVQLNNTLGCGTWGSVGYILVGILGPGRPTTKGIELAQIDASAEGIILTAELVPTQIGDEVIYTPSPLSD